MIRIPIHGTARQVQHVNLAVEAIRKFFTLEQANTFSVEARYLSTTAVKEKAYAEYRIVFYDDIDSHRQAAYDTIDKAANAADWGLQNIGGATYMSRVRECDLWLQAGSPADISSGQWGFMRAEGQRLKVIYNQTPTAQQIYNSLRNWQQEWEAQSELREKYRGVGKAYVEVATSLEQINSAVEKALSLIATL